MVEIGVHRCGRVAIKAETQNSTLITIEAIDTLRPEGAEILKAEEVLISLLPRFPGSPPLPLGRGDFSLQSFGRLAVLAAGSVESRRTISNALSLIVLACRNISMGEKSADRTNELFTIAI